MENIKVEKPQDEHIFDDEMRAKILEREKEIEQNPDCWIDYKKSIEDLRNRL